MGKNSISSYGSIGLSHFSLSKFEKELSVIEDVWLGKGFFDQNTFGNCQSRCYQLKDLFSSNPKWQEKMVERFSQLIRGWKEEGNLSLALYQELIGIKALLPLVKKIATLPIAPHCYFSILMDNEEDRSRRIFERILVLESCPENREKTPLKKPFHHHLGFQLPIGIFEKMVEHLEMDFQESDQENKKDQVKKKIVLRQEIDVFVACVSRSYQLIDFSKKQKDFAENLYHRLSARRIRIIEQNDALKFLLPQLPTIPSFIKLTQLEKVIEKPTLTLPITQSQIQQCVLIDHRSLLQALLERSYDQKQKKERSRNLSTSDCSALKDGGVTRKKSQKKTVASSFFLSSKTSTASSFPLRRDRKAVPSWANLQIQAPSFSKQWLEKLSPSVSWHGRRTSFASLPSEPVPIKKHYEAEKKAMGEGDLSSSSSSSSSSSFMKRSQTTVNISALNGNNKNGVDEELSNRYRRSKSISGNMSEIFSLDPSPAETFSNLKKNKVAKGLPSPLASEHSFRQEEGITLSEALREDPWDGYAGAGSMKRSQTTCNLSEVDSNSSLEEENNFPPKLSRSQTIMGNLSEAFLLDSSLEEPLSSLTAYSLSHSPSFQSDSDDGNSDMDVPSSTEIDSQEDPENPSFVEDGSDQELELVPLEDIDENKDPDIFFQETYFPDHILTLPKELLLTKNSSVFRTPEVLNFCAAYFALSFAPNRSLLGKEKEGEEVLLNALYLLKREDVAATDLKKRLRYTCDLETDDSFLKERESSESPLVVSSFPFQNKNLSCLSLVTNRAEIKEDFMKLTAQESKVDQEKIGETLKGHPIVDLSPKWKDTVRVTQEEIKRDFQEKLFELLETLLLSSLGGIIDTSSQSEASYSLPYRGYLILCGKEVIALRKRIIRDLLNGSFLMDPSSPLRPGPSFRDREYFQKINELFPQALSRENLYGVSQVELFDPEFSFSEKEEKQLGLLSYELYRESSNEMNNPLFYLSQYLSGRLLKPYLEDEELFILPMIPLHPDGGVEVIR